jgi:DNA-binding protein H-NS
LGIQHSFQSLQALICSYTNGLHRELSPIIVAYSKHLATYFAEENPMVKANLASMSIDELLKLRDDIGKTLSSKAAELRDQLSRLGGEADYKRMGRGSSLKGRKVAIKYRDKSGNTWAGRGAQPVWLREKLKAGAKLEDFAVQKTVATRKSSPRKSKKQRRASR